MFMAVEQSEIAFEQSQLEKTGHHDQRSMRRYFKPCILYDTPCLTNLQYDTLVICHTI